jgi:23S rRNA pseudouridine2605 synthase
MTNNSTHGERIAKAIARAGLASRREAEQWIATGRVAVNGEVINSPARNVTAADRISVDGAPLPARERTRLFLYHKPRGLVTTHSDPQGRPTIFERLPKHLPRLISIGRLDFNTEGLLLLTNDGGLARVLELPVTGWLRRYRVRAHGSVTQEKLDELRAGITIDGTHYGEIDATLERLQGSNLWLTFAIREGKNREVRNVLGHFDLTVTRLIRTSFGPFQLKDLPEGEVEEVRTRVLREQLGERVIALAGADFSTPLSPPPLPPPAPSRSEENRESGRSKPPGHEPAGREGKTQKKTLSKSASHSWRAPAPEGPSKKLRRKFHGARRDDAQRPQRSGDDRGAGLVTDRKGRRVLVERFEKAAPQPAPQRAPRKGPRRSFGKPPRRPRDR